MLTGVSMKSTDKAVKSSDYRVHVRQEANSRWLNFIKVPMGIYCLSGTDSTRRFNRFMHRIGEAPVIYDADLTEYSRRSIEGALRTKGYLKASVTADTVNKKKKKRRTRLHP